MSCTSKEYLNTCKKYLGCKESDGSYKKIIDLYNTGRKPLPRNYTLQYGDPWCAGFITAMAIACHATDIIPSECSCDEMYKKGKLMGIAIELENWTPKIGDIVFYDWNVDKSLDHVGVLDTVVGDNIKVIEGNKSDSVSIRQTEYTSGFITKVLRPRYKKVKKTDKTVNEYIKAVENVVNGIYGNYPTRKNKLEELGFNYEKVQKIVDILYK